ncbi:MAG TPA: family 16 glycoside hydrolase, partial [Gemmataceae bacterium]|nr:family 16 glycoside hydrolase [Gemmataceae bacterium]
CRQAVANVTPDSFLGKVRDAGPHGSSFPPALERPVNAPNRTGQQPMNTPSCPNLPPELAQHPKYRILRELGRGGMGVVYQARQTGRMDRQVVIKVISRALIDQPAALERFLREVHAAAQLSHPNIVTAYDAEKAGDLHMLVMEFVPGQSLAEVLAKQGPLPAAKACQYMRQVAWALQHALERGMVHRDIKPHNLMLTPKGQVKVLDFGLAKVVSERAAGKGLTASDAYMGTPEYCAPEQATDARNADIRADLYSLGCTLYCLLAGRPPFQDDTAMKIILAHLQQEPQPLPEVPERLWHVIARLLAKEPGQRYQKPLEVVQALTPFVKPGAKPEPKSGTAPAAKSKPKSEPAPTAKPEKGTMLAADTRQIQKVLREVPGKAPPRKVLAAAASPSSEQIDRVGFPKESGRARPEAKPSRMAWWKSCGLLAAVLAISLVLIPTAVIIIHLMTEEGTLVVEVNEANADVFVDGRTVKVSWQDGGKKAEIRVPPGTHKVEVKKGGFTAYGEEVKIQDGKRRVLRARLLPPLPRPDEDKEKWVSLFNGKNLDGWKTHSKQPGNWRVVKGTNGNVLIGSGAVASYLYSERGDYKNFHLRVEARINDEGCGGVYIRGPFGPQLPGHNPMFAHGYEAQITGTASAGISTGSLYMSHDGSRFSDVDVPIPRGQWFRMEVIAQGDRIIVKVNDKTTADYQDKKRRLTSGHIALEQFGAATEIEFRKIEIMELPASKSEAPLAPKPEAPPTAPRVDKEQGFVPLFNGKDLTGWKASGSPTWKVVEGVIEGTLAEPTPSRSDLTTTRTFGDFHLRLETTLAEGPSRSAIQFRKGLTDGYMVYIRGTTSSPEKHTGDLVTFKQGNRVSLIHKETQADPVIPLQPGEWFSLEIIAKGAKLTVLVKGEVVATFEDQQRRFSSGVINLVRYAKSKVRFRKIEIKELPSTTAPNPPETVEVLTPAQAAGKVGQKVTVQFFVQQWGGAADFVGLYSEPDWRRPGNFMIFFPKSSREKFQELGIRDVGRHFHRKTIRVTGTVTTLRFQAGSCPGIVIDEPKQIVIPDPPKPRTDGEAKSRKIEDKAPPTPRVREEKRFVPLFNGKDLTGWKTQPELEEGWRIENGVLFWSRGDRGFLRTKRDDFTDFHLRLELRIRDRLYAQLYVPGGYVLALNSTNNNPNKTGSLFAPSRRWMTFAKTLVRPDQWFTLEVIVKGNHVVVKVNGQTTRDFPDPDRRFARGHVELAGAIQCRKIEIKELK